MGFKAVLCATESAPARYHNVVISMERNDGDGKPTRELPRTLALRTICRVHTVDFGIIATLQGRWSKRGGNSVETLFLWTRSLVPSQYLDAPS